MLNHSLWWCGIFCSVLRKWDWFLFLSFVNCFLSYCLAIFFVWNPSNLLQNLQRISYETRLESYASYLFTQKQHTENPSNTWIEQVFSFKILFLCVVTIIEYAFFSTVMNQSLHAAALIKKKYVLVETIHFCTHQLPLLQCISHST